MTIATRPTREELDQLYNVEKLSQKDTGQRLGVSTHVIENCMKSYGIKARPKGTYYPHPQNSPPLNYVAVRRKTGICDICGQAIAGHPKCKRCTILVGHNHYETAMDKRGMCGHCQPGQKNILSKRERSGPSMAWR